MQEALKHLNDQPELWPRWKRGYRFEVGGPTPTDDQHLFIFVREGNSFGGRFGTVRAACHFVDGAAHIEYDNERRLETSDENPLCEHCFDVELQHAFGSPD